jgi:hypothetical protein
MGILDFLKKKEDPMFNNDMNMDLSADLSGIGHHDINDFSTSETQNPGLSPNYGSPSNAVNLSTMSLNNPNVQNQGFQGNNLEKDIQIISLKLDAIKSEIDNINQRVKNIEMIAEKEQQQAAQQKRWY